MPTPNRSKNIIVSILLLVSLVIVHWFFAEREFFQGGAYFTLGLGLALILKGRGWPMPAFGLVFLFLAALTDTLGNVAGFYGSLAWYDNFTHAFNLAAITVFLASYFRYHFKRQSIWLAAFGAFLLAMFLGSFYEITELGMQTIFGERMIWGELDTATDLLWNMIGAATGVFIWVGAQKIWMPKAHG